MRWSWIYFRLLWMAYRPRQYWGSFRARFSLIIVWFLDVMFKILLALSRLNFFPFPRFHHRYGGIPIHYGHNGGHNIQHGVRKANSPVIFCQRSFRWHLVQNNRGLWPSKQGTCLSAWEVSLHFFFWVLINSFYEPSEHASFPLSCKWRLGMYQLDKFLIWIIRW